MDVTLDLITEEIISIDVIEEAAAEITVVSGVPGSDGVGVVAGGTTGQVLVKASNTNFDTEWADPEVAAGVASVNGETGTVVLNQDEVLDGTTYKQYSSTEKTKLAGVATGATANDTDANLKNRANHTGSQAISTVTSLQASLDAKAPLASPAFTGTPTGITKSHVGLGNVDNTADTAKPVSTAQQTALDAKADASATTSALAGKQPLDQDLTDLAALSPTNNDVLQRKTGAWTNRTPAQLKTDLALAKGDVGLGNVDNTADTAKPVSTAQQTALDLKAPLASPAFTGTPTGITKSHVGLGNVDNTADTAKPVSTAQQTALDARFVWADGTTSTNARPSTSSKVIWVGGTTQPVNMATGDLWIKA
jgi:hypothetical protein